MASFLADTDSDDELPVGWEERVTLDGKVFYANHQTKSTQWTHPKTGKKRVISGELPFGWERSVLPNGDVVFVDHINKKTTYTDPRLAFAVEEKDNVTDIRQRFDSSSTALQVLHGRDLSNKVAVITGANCGIGYETAKAFAFHGVHVIIACRDLDKANDAIKNIVKQRHHAKVQALKCDLSSFKSVKEFVEQFEALNLPIHILVLNAAVFALPHATTEDGIEKTFQVNYLSHFYLVKLLRQTLIKSAPCRVVVVSSESHRFSQVTKENLSSNLLSPPSSRNFSAMMAYNDSKLCNILFSSALSHRLQRYGVTCNAVHPGNMISTSLSRNWWLYRLAFALVRPFTKSVEQGAATSVYCATAVELDDVTGLYFNNCLQTSPSKAAQDIELSELLWILSDKMIENALQERSLLP
ncbi:WW domain-containing oxidoreductase-like isoform X1 [Dinothrombium tinctorium]|uniref:WW domain-containing oxidoreductase n=1 Tax=Dinothrombium tinctorium TaxID=1965070 RepID=A0A443R735_9ACAR|nr:WW domain-containing oxidoreductase-like isoform X1 [Dinothrombium tinctorium]RWS11734.1 WW domain-containing oxidoreductase-like isoform X1 [Dinothrombium tinctorium]RWS11891.1 WW domain-containing oxidoreductase-like isoform X1 [Dinothrombium tinctorium]